VGSEYDSVAPAVVEEVADCGVTAGLDGPDDPEADPALAAELAPEPEKADPVADAPELIAPPPGSPMIDGVMVTVAVGNMVVVMTVLVMMVVGPLKIIVFPSPKISICVGPGR
jgi:hypothetical protein